MCELDDLREDFFHYDPEDKQVAAAWKQMLDYELSRKPWFSVIKYNFNEIKSKEENLV